MKAFFILLFFSVSSFSENTSLYDFSRYNYERDYSIHINAEDEGNTAKIEIFKKGKGSEKKVWGFEGELKKSSRHYCHVYLKQGKTFEDIQYGVDYTIRAVFTDKKAKKKEEIKFNLKAVPDLYFDLLARKHKKFIKGKEYLKNRFINNMKRLVNEKALPVEYKFRVIEVTDPNEVDSCSIRFQHKKTDVEFIQSSCLFVYKIEMLEDLPKDNASLEKLLSETARLYLDTKEYYNSEFDGEIRPLPQDDPFEDEKYSEEALKLFEKSKNPKEKRMEFSYIAEQNGFKVFQIMNADPKRYDEWKGTLKVMVKDKDIVFFGMKHLFQSYPTSENKWDNRNWFSIERPNRGKGKAQ